jgi:hypothetical protein
LDFALDPNSSGNRTARAAEKSGQQHGGYVDFLDLEHVRPPFFRSQNTLSVRDYRGKGVAAGSARQHDRRGPFGALRRKRSARRRPASPGSARHLFDNAIKLGKFVGLQPAQTFFVNCQYRVVLSRWRRLHAVRVFVPDGPGERFSDRPFSEFMKALRDFLRVSHVIFLHLVHPHRLRGGEHAQRPTLIAV